MLYLANKVNTHLTTKYNARVDVTFVVIRKYFLQHFNNTNMLTVKKIIFKNIELKVMLKYMITELAAQNKSVNCIK